METWLAVAGSAGSVCVGGVFLASGWSKISDLRGARLAFLDYQLGPGVFSFVAVPLAFTELAIGLACVVGSATGAASAVVLLAGFSVVAGSALARELRIDCHCGPGDEVLSAGTLRRNAVLSALASLNVAAHLTYPAPDNLMSAGLPASIAVAMVVGSAAMAYALFIVSERREGEWM